jgi:hypothetical protein
MNKQLRAAIAARMRQALRWSGIDAKIVAHQMSTTNQNLKRYLEGERAPDDETMRLFARIVGSSEEYLWHGIEPAAGFVHEELVEPELPAIPVHDIAMLSDDHLSLLIVRAGMEVRNRLRRPN